MVNKSIIQGTKYKYIINPKTGRRVLIRGEIGKKILKNYYNYYKNAGIQLGGNKYSYVINPRTGRRVSLHGRYGQKIFSVVPVDFFEVDFHMTDRSLRSFCFHFLGSRQP